MKYKVLIVEDDGVICASICEALSRWGFDAKGIEDFSDVAGEFERFDPHIVLMDISLTYYNGYYWCEIIRRRSAVPIIFLSSRSDDMDVIMAVNMGADDYIAKPVAPELLLAKIQALLRRAYDYKAGEPKRDICGWSLNSARSCLVREDQTVQLTRNELCILSMLIEAHGEIVSRDRIMLSLWNNDEFIDDNTLSVNVNRLRNKLAGVGLNDVIRTHKGQGYAIME